MEHSRNLFKCGSSKVKLSQLLLYLLLIVLLAHSCVNIFTIHIPFPAKSSPVPASFSPEHVSGKPGKLVSLSSSVMYAVKEESPTAEKKTLLYKDGILGSFGNGSAGVFHIKKRHSRRALSKILGYEAETKQFSRRVKEFLHDSSYNSTCKFRFFMTWISSPKLFGFREIFSIESLFKSHPNGCLIIVSNSMDSVQGMEILSPFLDKGYRVTAISPDFFYLFKNTVARSWLDKLTKGNVNTGEVSLGQNLSNLLRLGLLYKFGGIYIDTDVIVLKSFHSFRNAIGAQTINAETRNWSRLNNAIMVFDKGHPLLYKFIEEFALTFDGNKWGHNGPYLVSRVVSRVSERPGYNNFTVLPPNAFYPVDWSRIRSLFRAPRDEAHSKWIIQKVKQIENQSFAVHLWNKESRGLEIQQGSIIQHIASKCCIFCNHTSGLGVLSAE